MPAKDEFKNKAQPLTTRPPINAVYNNSRSKKFSLTWLQRINDISIPERSYLITSLYIKAGKQLFLILKVQ